jgi:hypothetical protein
MRPGFLTGLESLMAKVATQLELPHVGPYRTPATPIPAPVAPTVPQRSLLSRMAKPLAIGGLAAGGALAAGLGSQYEDDRKKYPLVYAPLQGAY